MKTVKEVSDLTGISVRTLHYYDQIGLLHPAQVTNSGYRLYGADQMRQLQLILFLKELRIPLKEIIQILNSPTFDPNIVLQQHRQLLILTEATECTDSLCRSNDKRRMQHAVYRF